MCGPLPAGPMQPLPLADPVPALFGRAGTGFPCRFHGGEAASTDLDGFVARRFGLLHQLLIILRGLLTVASAASYLVCWLRHMSGNGKGSTIQN